MIRRPPRSTQSRSSAASDVYKRQDHGCGAHSQTDLEPGTSDWPDSAPVIDENRLEVVDLAAFAPVGTSDASTTETVEPTADATPDESIQATETVGAEPGTDVEP